MVTHNQAKKPFNFEERSHLFGQDVKDLTKKLPRTIANIEYIKQSIRSSGSVGANYIEADEGLSKKDCLKHLRISRKEAKETRHWLRLYDVQGNSELEQERQALTKEAAELVCILSAMIKKCDS